MFATTLVEKLHEASLHFFAPDVKFTISLLPCLVDGEFFFNRWLMMLEHDVIIVGGGLAGCRAAVEIARTDPSLKVAVVAKTHPIRSHSVAAQGGMAAS